MSDTAQEAHGVIHSPVVPAFNPDCLLGRRLISRPTGRQQAGHAVVLTPGHVHDEIAGLHDRFRPPRDEIRIVRQQAVHRHLPENGAVVSQPVDGLQVTRRPQIAGMRSVGGSGGRDRPLNPGKHGVVLVHFRPIAQIIQHHADERSRRRPEGVVSPSPGHVAVGAVLIILLGDDGDEVDVGPDGGAEFTFRHIERCGACRYPGLPEPVRLRQRVIMRERRLLPEGLRIRRQHRDGQVDIGLLGRGETQAEVVLSGSNLGQGHRLAPARTDIHPDHAVGFRYPIRAAVFRSLQGKGGKAGRGGRSDQDVRRQFSEVAMGEEYTREHHRHIIGFGMILAVHMLHLYAQAAVLRLQGGSDRLPALRVCEERGLHHDTVLGPELRLEYRGGMTVLPMLHPQSAVPFPQDVVDRLRHRPRSTVRGSAERELEVPADPFL